MTYQDCYDIYKHEINQFHWLVCYKYGRILDIDMRIIIITTSL